MSDEIDEYLDDVLNAHRAVLFMEGPLDAPLNAASAMGRDLLTALQITFHAEDISRRLAVADRIKARSDWTDLPQFFIDGQFICDNSVMMDAILSKQFDKILNARNITFDQATADEIRELNS